MPETHPEVLDILREAEHRREERRRFTSFQYVQTSENCKNHFTHKTQVEKGAAGTSVKGTSPLSPLLAPGPVQLRRFSFKICPKKDRSQNISTSKVLLEGLYDPLSKVLGARGIVMKKVWLMLDNNWQVFPHDQDGE